MINLKYPIKLSIEELFKLPKKYKVCVNKEWTEINKKKYYLQIFQGRTKQELFEKIEEALIYNKGDYKPPENGDTEYSELTGLNEQIKNNPNYKKIYLYYYSDDEKGSRMLREEKSADGVTMNWLSDIAVILI